MYGNQHYQRTDSSTTQLTPASSRANTYHKCLWFKNLPPHLNEMQVTDLIKQFGALSVRYMGEHGQFKNTAFAVYSTAQAAQVALHHCHQIDVLGCLLKVEYARGKADVLAPTPLSSIYSEQEKDGNNHKNELSPNPNIREVSQKADIHSKINYMSSDWDIPYPSDPHIQYTYPEPTEITLINIIHCLAAYPRFYTQVLHLMNKINLPPPFGPLTTEPPITKESISDEESELESDEEGGTLASKKGKKRKNAKVMPESLSKRLRLQIQQATQTSATNSVNSTTSANRNESKPKTDLEAVFEIGNHVAKTNIPVEVPITLSSVQSNEPERHVMPVCGFGTFGRPVDAADGKPLSPQQDSEGEDFIIPIETTPELIQLSKDSIDKNGKTFPSQLVTSNDQESIRVARKTVPMKQTSISESALSAGRLSKDDIISHPVLSKSTVGEPTSRLYVKNLAKQTTSENLHYIFSRYIEPGSTEQLETFKIQLMTSGRMKGQAFVTLPSVDAASKALLEVHGYVINDKPICISYAKSS